jgi:hypothetical protein
LWKGGQEVDLDDGALLFAAFLDFVMRQSLPERRRWGVKWEYAREAIAPIMNSNNGNAAAYFSEHPHRNMDQPFGKIIVGLLYADDMALTSSSGIGLQHMVTALNGALKAWGLTLCPEKSRYMVFSDGNHTPRLYIRVEGKKMAQVGEFCYLGIIISADGTCLATIDDRIRKAWFRLHQSHYIWRLGGLTQKARATFFRCIVLTTFFHGCERWTPCFADMTKLRMNHHKMLAKALHIPHWHRNRVPRAQLRHLMDDMIATWTLTWKCGCSDTQDISCGAKTNTQPYHLWLWAVSWTWRSSPMML